MKSTESARPALAHDVVSGREPLDDRRRRSFAPLRWELFPSRRLHTMFVAQGVIAPVDRPSQVLFLTPICTDGNNL